MKETRMVVKIIRSLLKKSHYVVVIIKELPKKNGYNEGIAKKMDFVFNNLRSYRKITSP